MENEKNITANEAAENAEQSAEQKEMVQHEPLEKTYTQSEVDAIIGQRVGRNTAKIRKEYEKYSELESVLKAGTGEQSIEKITESLKEFYLTKGVDIPQKTQYSQKDIEILARAEADEIISLGEDEVTDELNRLTGLGAQMSPKEKLIFKSLADHDKHIKQNRELAEIGVEQDVIDSREFKEFAGQFTSNTPIKRIYDIYSKMQPRKEIKTMGSMKNKMSDNSGVKDYYSFEEASKFTKADLDKNPELYKRICESMRKW